MTFAIILCGFLAINKARKWGIRYEDMLILISTTLGLSLICGVSLYIVVTYSFLDIYTYISKLNFTFLKNSGLVFYGGLVGGILSALICSKLLDIKFEYLEQCIVPYIPLGHAIGRIGCFFAGCCYGVEYSGIFAVTSIFDPLTGTHFPIQLIEALLNLIMTIVLLLYTKKQRNRYNVLLSYLILYTTSRFILEFFRGDEIRGEFLIFSTSQWISIIIFAFSIAKKYMLYKRSK